METNQATARRQTAAGQNRVQQAYEEIRRRIFDGEFAPATALSEQQLALTLQLSRTPVREAIKRLEQEGLIHSVANRGTFVAEISARDIVEIYQVREQLESFAARVAAERMSREEIAALQQEVAVTEALAAAGRVTEIFQSDIRLHKRIIAATENRRLSEILATLDDQMHRIRALLPRSPEWLELTLRDHAAIVERIAAGDALGAEQAMAQHLRRACENALRLTLPLHFR